MLEEMWCLAL